MSIRVYNSSNTSWVPAKEMYVYDGTSWRRHTSMKVGESGNWKEVFTEERSNITKTYYNGFSMVYSSANTTSSSIVENNWVVEDGKVVVISSISTSAGIPSYVPANLTLSLTGMGSSAHPGDTFTIRNTSNNYGFDINFSSSTASYDANTGVSTYTWYGTNYIPVFTSNSLVANTSYDVTVNTAISWVKTSQTIPGSLSYSPAGGSSGSPTLLEDYGFMGPASVTISTSPSTSVVWSYVKGGVPPTVSVANNGSATSLTATLSYGGGPAFGVVSVESSGQYWEIELTVEDLS